MLLGVSTANAKSAEVLYASEVHHVIDDRFSYVFCELIIVPRETTDELVLFAHAPKLNDLAQAYEALAQSSYYSNSSAPQSLRLQISEFTSAHPGTCQ